MASLVEIMARVREQLPGVCALVVGDGPQLDLLKRLCEQLGLSVSEDGNDHAAAVYLIGYRGNPARYCDLADVFVLGSSTEGCPNSLIEALMTGIPVLANDAPWGARYVLADNRIEGLSTPYPTSTPVDTGVGLLMPRIDHNDNHGLWRDAIVSVLEQGDDGRAEARREQARTFDESIVAPGWLELVSVVAHD